MKLANKLIGYLNRVFNKDPRPFLAIRMEYEGGLTLSVEDEILTAVTVGGPGSSFTMDLKLHTIESAANWIAARPGFSVQDFSLAHAGRSARVLVDVEAVHDGRLFGFSSLLWAWMDAVAVELQLARATVASMPAQLDVNQSSGFWLDEIGSYFFVKRADGETDASYGPRIIAETVRPLSNNVALEKIIEAATGIKVVVATGANYTGAFPLFDGSFLYDYAGPTEESRHRYNAVAARPAYGVFDVGYDSDDIVDPEQFDFDVRAVVERARGAGLLLRSVRPYLKDFDGNPVFDQNGGLA